MKLLVVVNRVSSVKASQGAVRLARQALKMGWRVLFTDVGQLGVDPDGHTFAWTQQTRRHEASPVAYLGRLRGAAKVRTPLAQVDAVMIRTNPGRDGSRMVLHDAALSILRMARDAGTTVLSDPDGLARASSKLYVSRLPAAVRPATLVSRNPSEIEAFVRSRSARSIIKPVSGTQGTDVFRVEPDEPANLRQIIDVVVRQGYAVIQEWLPEAVAGDVRLIVLNGQLLEVDGRVAAVRRVPASGEIRSNVFRGGMATKPERVQAWADVVDQIRPQLVADRLFLVGLDLIGSRIVEVNVYSPGGLQDAEAFAQVNFATPILVAAQEAVEANNP